MRTTFRAFHLFFSYFFKVNLATFVLDREDCRISHLFNTLVKHGIVTWLWLSDFQLGEI